MTAHGPTTWFFPKNPIVVGSDSRRTASWLRKVMSLPPHVENPRAAVIGIGKWPALVACVILRAMLALRAATMHPPLWPPSQALCDPRLSFQVFHALLHILLITLVPMSFLRSLQNPNGHARADPQTVGRCSLRTTGSERTIANPAAWCIADQPHHDLVSFPIV